MVDRERIELSPEACKATVLPLSLTAHITYYLSHCTPQVKASIGLRGEARTPDPMLPKQVRYQTALHGDKNNRMIFVARQPKSLAICIAVLILKLAPGKGIEPS